jgi:hypothetical protein
MAAPTLEINKIKTIKKKIFAKKTNGKIVKEGLITILKEIC